MSRRERARLAWSPCWDGKVLAWTKWYINENKWRCDRIHAFEDLLQDYWIIFNKICERYPRVVDEKHFMALYVRAVSNQMNDRSLYTKRKREIHQDTVEDVSDLYTGRIGEVSNAGYATLLLDEAPEELKIALRLIEQCPRVLRMKAPRGTGRENLNMRLRRILGIDFDFAGSLKNLLA